MNNFALIGAAGFIAPRHLKAIRDTGNILVAATDPHDSVGVLDQYFPEAAYFREFERFDRHIEKLRRGPADRHIHYVSICSPNYLHDAHIRLALRVGAHAICEKPLVLNPWNCEALRELEAESSGRIYPVLQLRCHPGITAFREQLLRQPAKEKHEVCLTYLTPRGSWYLYSWKGKEEQSGGLAANIGIHLFDLLLWLFGSVTHSELHWATPTTTAGFLELERARVTWLLSIDRRLLSAGETANASQRTLKIDGEELDFTKGMEDLHMRVYESILAERWFGIDEARPSIKLVHDLRRAIPVPPSPGGDFHPLLAARNEMSC